MDWRLTGIVAVGLSLAGCAGGLAPPGERSSSDIMQARGERDGATSDLIQRSAGAARPAQYTVERGDTLFSIAFDHDLTYQEVARWNEIDPPYEIYPGQTIRLRPGDDQVHRARLPDDGQDDPPSDDERPARQDRGEDAGGTGAVPAERASASSPTGPDWHWPTEGDVIQSFDPDATGRRGVRIGGSNGQAIHAAAEGDVVYSGSGLIGYGNLIIIKHNPTFLSAYGHNQTLYVAEGETVERGEQIADMGQSGSDRPLLHFEIRKEGRPVDPLEYLPPR